MKYPILLIITLILVFPANAIENHTYTILPIDYENVQANPINIQVPNEISTLEIRDQLWHELDKDNKFRQSGFIKGNQSLFVNNSKISGYGNLSIVNRTYHAGARLEVLNKTNYGNLSTGNTRVFNQNLTKQEMPKNFNIKASGKQVKVLKKLPKGEDTIPTEEKQRWSVIKSAVNKILGLFGLK